MDYEMIDCIDAGTQFCPCHLAETNECILCSQLQGKSFCDCKNWKGTCIYQEFFWNGSKASSQRKEYIGVIVEKEEIGENLFKLVIESKHELCKELVEPGGFVFIRCQDNTPTFDVPISIMESNPQEDTISVIIEVEGIKTKKIHELKEGDSLILKGPFWNGIFGLKNIKNAYGKNVLIVARGIGQSPIVPLLKKLSRYNSNIHLLIDKGKYKDLFINDSIDKYSVKITELKTLHEGKLTEVMESILDKAIRDGSAEHIHCSGPDILIYEMIGKVDNRVTTSCSNNAKMCCGEGICGACTTRFQGHLVKRLCKLQTNPEYIFEGRRLI